MNTLLSLNEMLDAKAIDSPLFWAVVGVIAGIIAIIAMRDLFLWYFKINELYDRVNDLTEKVEQLCKNGVPAAAGSAGAVAGDDSELAAAVGAARFLAEGGALGEEAEVALAIAIARQKAQG